MDLDSDYECAPLLRSAWLPEPTSGLCFRVAVREVEAWLIADVGPIAGFLSVEPTKITGTPEELPDPKLEIVNLARQSHRRAIREDMVPRSGSGRDVGPAFASRLIEYVQSAWRPEVAAKHSGSLKRALRRLSRLAG